MPKPGGEDRTMETITCGSGYYVIKGKIITAVRKDKNGHLTRRSDADVWREINFEIDSVLSTPP